MSVTTTESAPPRGATLAGLYALFALISTSVNLGVQATTLQVVDSVLVALAAGTIAALPVKYVLDKRYIFRFQTTGIGHDGTLFVLYGALSVVTTAVFWGTEWVTHRLTSSVTLTLLGGAVGLAIGYMTKYWLDLHFVFVARPATQAPEGGP